MLDASILDACGGPEGVSRSFPNTPEGVADLIVFCQEHGAGLVAMEATGGYEQPVVASLQGAGLSAAILNPREVRRFAESMGRLEKTDRIDAGMIAWFASVRKVRVARPVRPEQAELRALVTRLGQLTRESVTQRNQLRQSSLPRVQESIRELLALIARQIKELAAEVAQLLAADPLWSRLDQALREIKGIADRSVGLLMAELPELGTLGAKAVSKLAGLAPIARDSGQHQGRRRVRGGRAEVRSLLYLVARGVAIYEPEFRQFQERLKKAGKPSKVIRIALAHKLLVRLNAKARDARRELALLDPQLARP